MLVAACGEPDAPDECNPGARESRLRYDRPTVPFGTECVPQVQARMCTDGTWTEWTGSYMEEACAAEPPLDCSDPAAAHGAVDERSRYRAAEVPFGETCEVEMQTRTCSNGTWTTWSGTYAAETCVVADPASCTDPSTAHGGMDQRTRYATATVPFGSTCEPEVQTRTCSDGTWSTWSGTFVHETCSEEAPLACQSPAAPHGGIDTRTRFAAASVPYGASCTSELQQRSCSNGAWSAWSGTLAFETCRVPTLASVRIVPGSPVLALNRQLVFRAVATLDDSSEQDVTTLAAWSSNDPSIVALGGTGVATGIATGSTTIAADLDGKHADAVAVVRSWTTTTIAPYAFRDLDFAGDQKSRAMVAWGDAGSVVGQDVVMTRAWQGSWSPSELVATYDDDVAYVRAATNPRGDRHVMWKVPNRAANTQFLYTSNRLFQASAWSVPVKLSDYASNGAPALALAVVGRALATWIGANQEYSSFIPQTGWQVPTGLAMRRGYDVAIDPFGNGIVNGADTWLSPTVGSAIYAYHYDRDSSSVGPRVSVYETANTSGPVYESATRGPIGMDAFGNALTVWVHDSGTSKTLMSSRYIPSVGWAAPQPILNVGSSQVISGNLSVHPSGTAAFAFSSNYGGQGHRVFVTTFSPETGWDIPTPLSTSGINTALVLAGETVATAKDGRALALWSEVHGSAVVLLARRYDPEAGWAPAEQLAEGYDFSDESAFGLDDGFFIGYVGEYDEGYFIESAVFH